VAGTEQAEVAPIERRELRLAKSLDDRKGEPVSVADGQTRSATMP
jgi:hypothetical protein